MKVFSCTEAGKILNTTKKDVRMLVEEGILMNYGNSYRYMVSEENVEQLKSESEKLY
ncbi:hypothetical protein ACOJQI_15935 [Bacillus salacetis]|uniref:hypothetical protein n=1 Tax=Bacillus salacetis TaxID=2315464 RepID=UPI003B9F2E04